MMQKKTHKKVRFPELLAVILNLNITAGFSQKKKIRESRPGMTQLKTRVINNSINIY
jgi:hypothetical protein